MASVSLLNSVYPASPVTSLASGAISPAANSLLIAVMSNHIRNGTTLPNINSCSTTLSGVTFTELVNPGAVGGVHCVELSVWIGQCGATPGTGTITVGWATSNARLIMAILQVIDHDTADQVAQTKLDTTTSGTTASATFDTAPAADSLVLGLLAERALASGDNMTPALAELFEGYSLGSGSRAGLNICSVASGAGSTVGWSTLNDAEHAIALLEINNAGAAASVSLPVNRLNNRIQHLLVR